MLRWVRRKIREINYYAANREQTIWTRAADIALAVSLVVSIPVTWYFDARMRRVETVYDVAGMIQRTPEAGYIAYVARPDREPDWSIPPEQLFAHFRIEVDRMQRGFPLVTSEIVRQPIIDLRTFDNPTAPATLDTGLGSPMRAAIATALQTSEVADAGPILALWESGGVQITNHWLAWFAGAFLWWVALFVVSSILILLVRMGYIVIWRHQAVQYESLVAAGRCPNCRYDLRGLEFSDRCPECGELLD